MTGCFTRLGFTGGKTGAGALVDDGVPDAPADDVGELGPEGAVVCDAGGGLGGGELDGGALLVAGALLDAGGAL